MRGVGYSHYSETPFYHLNCHFCIEMGFYHPQVQDYVKLVKPVTINDVNAMRFLRSRIDIFKILQVEKNLIKKILIIIY